MFCFQSAIIIAKMDHFVIPLLAMILRLSLENFELTDRLNRLLWKSIGMEACLTFKRE
jgi:hypothetical protein